MSGGTNKRYKLFIVNYDWRDIFRTGREEYYEKLQRDQLCPEVNEFFFFSWAKESYDACEGKWCTKHQKTFGLEKLRPLLNIWALFAIPYASYRYNVKPDVWLVYDFGMVPAMWLASKLFGGVLVMYVNNNPQDCSSTRRFGKTKQMYSKFAGKMGVLFVKHFFTLNESMRSYLMKLGVQKENIYIYTVNTIERDSKHILNAQKGYVREKYALPNDTKILLTVARLETEKNYPLLISLFAGLPKNYVLFCLGDGNLLKELKKQTEKLSVEDRVFFLGFIDREEIWNYYRDVDVFVLLSKAEALGIVFWEAMYMGVPTIGSNIEGIVESLGKGGERGKIWKDPDGQEGFNNLVSFCVTPSGERDTMVALAKKFVDEQLKNKETLNNFLGRLNKNR